MNVSSGAETVFKYAFELTPTIYECETNGSIIVGLSTSRPLEASLAGSR